MTQWLLIMVLSGSSMTTVQQHFVTKKSCEKMRLELEKKFKPPHVLVGPSFCIEHNVLD